MGAFVEVAQGSSQIGELVTGTRIKARIVGSTITMYVNGSARITYNAATEYLTRQPGIGFFKRVGGSNPDYGLASLSAVEI